MHDNRIASVGPLKPVHSASPTGGRTTENRHSASRLAEHRTSCTTSDPIYTSGNYSPRVEEMASLMNSIVSCSPTNSRLAVSV